MKSLHFDAAAYEELMEQPIKKGDVKLLYGGKVKLYIRTVIS